MLYHRMPIEIESPEEMGYQHIKINLAESSVAELALSSLGVNLNTIKLEYTSHRGHEGLRELIANENDQLRAGDVLLTGGAAMALFIIHTSILTKEDHLIVIHPNYSSNLEVPKLIGCELTPIRLNIKHQWRIDFTLLETSIQSNTKLISLTSPHNPTGQMLSDEEIEKLKVISEKYNIHILVDETYRDACFSTPYPLIAGIDSKFISVLSFSKGYGLPGIRMGAIVTLNEEMYTRFLAAKEMIQICNPPLEEAIAFEFYKNKKDHLHIINLHAQSNLEILKHWLTIENRVEAIMPQGGVVCFVRIKAEGLDFKNFYAVLLNEFGTLVGPGHWFDMSDRFMRIGFGYSSGEVLQQGLDNISQVLNKMV
ncbi:MAG: pyridoxal phosphate-dependent aminotransferase [Saprospiraceae bacterium]